MPNQDYFVNLNVISEMEFALHNFQTSQFREFFYFIAYSFRTFCLPGEAMAAALYNIGSGREFHYISVASATGSVYINTSSIHSKNFYHYY